MRKIINFILVLLIIWVALLYPFRLAWFEGVLQIPEDLHAVFLVFVLWISDLFLGHRTSSGQNVLQAKRRVVQES